MVSRGEHGTRDESEETVTAIGTGAGTGGRTSTGMSARVEMGARTKAGTGAGTGERTGTRKEMRVKEINILGIHKVITEVGRKAREGRCRQRVARNHSRKTRCPSKTVASS